MIYKMCYKCDGTRYFLTCDIRGNITSVGVDYQWIVDPTPVAPEIRRFFFFFGNGRNSEMLSDGGLVRGRDKIPSTDGNGLGLNKNQDNFARYQLRQRC